MTGAKLKDCRPHDLRRSLASYMAIGGSSLPTIGAMFGHSQPSTTAIYARLSTDPVRLAAETAATAMLGYAKATVNGDGITIDVQATEGGDVAKRKVRTARQAKIPKEVRKAIAAPRATELLFLESSGRFSRVRANLASWQARHLMRLDAGDVDTARQKAFEMGVWIGDYRATQALAQESRRPKAKHGKGRFGTSKGSNRQRPRTQRRLKK